MIYSIASDMFHRGKYLYHRTLREPTVDGELVLIGDELGALLGLEDRDFKGD
jgi:hypothetical protein